jgi:hypothetical protein
VVLCAYNEVRRDVERLIRWQADAIICDLTAEVVGRTARPLPSRRLAAMRRLSWRAERAWVFAGIAPADDPFLAWATMMALDREAWGLTLAEFGRKGIRDVADLRRRYCVTIPTNVEEVA